jgi:ABC-type antimicrobial peptide transport system permease subunit
MTLMCVFAGIATVLSAVGIYSVIAHAMAERTREIGIRLSLGAARSDVWRLALGQIGWPVGLGLAIGEGAALALTPLISTLLWGVAPTDAPTYLGVSVLMIVVALAAAFVPARRALRIAPTVALKCE